MGRVRKRGGACAEPQMGEIAELISRVWVGNEDPSKVRKEVRRLRRDFPSVRFT